MMIIWISVERHITIENPCCNFTNNIAHDCEIIGNEAKAMYRSNAMFSPYIDTDLKQSLHMINMGSSIPFRYCPNCGEQVIIKTGMPKVAKIALMEAKLLE